MIVRYVFRGKNNPKYGGLSPIYTVYALFGIVPLYVYRDWP